MDFSSILSAVFFVYVLTVSPLREGMRLRKEDPNEKRWFYVKSKAKVILILSSAIAILVMLFFHADNHTAVGIIAAIIAWLSSPLYILGYLAPESWRRWWFV